MDRFGWGIRNREGRDLIELVTINGLAVVGTFFKKQKATKYRIEVARTQPVGSEEAADVEGEGLQDNCL